MRRQQQQAHSQTQLQFEQSDEENTNSSPSAILERVQSDRVTVTKPEEDRRRRTIIVEKRNGTFGFTLQSYGIHYKKEQEIEMITYVDYVDYDGPAYRAGMREGDVILSINGVDMEKADHKTLVGFIQSCDTRMRMVVLFEDCVRKVELHMRYIQLQRILQTKMSELEKLCLRERKLLEGKWKTHSLPARKKSIKPDADATITTTTTSSRHRPTVSTEDVAAKVTHRHHHQQHAQPTTLILAYQYLDPRYRYMLQPSTTSSGEYLLTFEQAHFDDGERHHFVVKTPCESAASQQQQQQPKKKQSEHTCTGHLCNPCLHHQNNNNSGDNTSLDAYDLASPCCDPHCVPIHGRRRSRHKKRGSKSEETQTEPTRVRPHSTSSSGAPRRYFQIGADLHSSCASSCIVPTTISGETTTTTTTTSSYSTSLSTDTLYWDGAAEMLMHQAAPYVQCATPPPKPKSWDNLTSAAIGYAYKETKSSSAQCARRVCQPSKKVIYATTTMTPPQRRYVHTKSTESLLSVPPGGSSNECCFQTPPSNDANFGYYSTRRRQQPTSRNVVSTSSEATRL